MEWKRPSCPFDNGGNATVTVVKSSRLPGRQQNYECVSNG